MERSQDQMVDHCIRFAVDLLKYREDGSQPCTAPFFLGLSGIQGAGKTTLVSKLRDILSSEPFSLGTLAFSIDDLYLSHSDLSQVARSNSSNPLLQHRGLPGTHDMELALTVLSSLRSGIQTLIPRYDKAAYGGHGDRMDKSCWIEVNKEGERQIQIVIVEGWCIGFKPVSTQELESNWRKAVDQSKSETYEGRLGLLKLENIQLINENLHKYDNLTNQLDALIHIDAESAQYVYKWRQEQENALRQSNGSGMTKEEVIAFVDNYYAAYELYLPALRDGIFDQEDKQLRLVLDKDRRVKEVYKL